ncbi:MAG: MFS transporter [Thermoleophilia bacterium]|nr:MFS transporter [Thermoleophilia bacterium]
MRRLLVLTSAAVLIETLFFAVLAPLLPGFADELSLSKWESGLLVAAYALGAGVAALPAGLLATRTDVRRVTILGLVAVAGTSVAFGIVDSYLALVLARLAQGAGSSFVWTGALAWLVTATPRERRGEMIGIAMAAAIGGALLGPVLGAAAERTSRAAAFVAVAVVCALLAAWATRIPSPGRGESQPLSLLLKAARSRPVLVGMWLLALPALLFGTLGVLGPLQLDRLGWGVVGIAGTFFVSAAIEATLNPLIGRWSDRRGRLAPIRFGLAGAIASSLTIPFIGDRWLLSGVIVLTGIAYGAFWTPAIALLTDGWEASGVEHGLGFAVMNLAWAPGHVVGSALGGGVADLGGDVAAYGLAAGLCVLTLAGLQRRALRAAGPASASGAG